MQLSLTGHTSYLTSTVIATQSQLSMASWDESNPDCSQLTLCFPEASVTLAAEDMSNYAAFSSTVLLSFFPFSFASSPLCSCLNRLVVFLLRRLTFIAALPLVDERTERCVAGAITNCVWYQTEIPASGSGDGLWQALTTLCCFLFHFLIDLPEPWTTLRAAPLVRRPVISRTCPDLFPQLSICNSGSRKTGDNF